MEFRNILVPVVGTGADEQAIRLACRLAKKNKTKIMAVHVITVKPTMPVDAEVESEIEKAENILDKMESAAEEEDYKIETDILQARDAGAAIIDESVEREADLILMGLPYKTPFGEFSMGQVGPHLLKKAKCRVVLVRDLPSG